VRCAAGAAACALLVAGACVAPVAPAADNAIDLQYRLRGAARASDVTATRLYGWVGERSLAVPSRCKMMPSDSAMFASRAMRCGGVAAWYQGIARLLLEQANSRRFARAIEADGRLRWMDLPAPCE
jgi:hypothetical protein